MLQTNKRWMLHELCSTHARHFKDLFACCRDPSLQKAEELRTRRQLCFVMTDLEGSTAMASKNQNVFVNIQEVHDVVCAPLTTAAADLAYNSTHDITSFRTFSRPNILHVLNSSAVCITPLRHLLR